MVETQPLESVQAFDSAIFAINEDPDPRPRTQPHVPEDRVLQPNDSRLSMEKGNIELNVAFNDHENSAGSSNE